MCGFDQTALRDSSSRRGPRGPARRPGGKQPPDAGLRGSVSSALLSLRALGCGVDHLARHDLGPKRPRTPARAKTGAGVPCHRRSTFRPFPTPRGSRSVGGGGGGLEGIGVETVVGVEARCGTVAPARRRLGKFCRVPGTRPPWPESLRSSFPAPLPLPRSRRGVRELRGGRGVPGRDRPYGRAAGRPGRPVIRLGPADARDGCRAPPGGRLYIVRSFRSHDGRDLATSHALDFQQAGGACGIVRVAPACRCPASGPEVAPAGLVGPYGRLHGSTSTRGRPR